MSFDERAAGGESAELVGVPAVDALSVEALMADGWGLAATELGGALEATEGATATGEEAAGPSALGWLGAEQPDNMARLIIAAAKAVRRSPTRATVREPRAAF